MVQSELNHQTKNKKRSTA